MCVQWTAKAKDTNAQVSLALQYLHFKVQHSGNPEGNVDGFFQMWSAILVLHFHRSLDPGQGQEPLRTIESQLHSIPTPHIQWLCSKTQ